MLPITNISEENLWQAEFFRVAPGLRGVIILWVFASECTSRNMVQHSEYANTVVWFNTAAFIILTGFSTHIQTRNKLLQYGNWVMSKWSGLMPMYLLLMLTVWMPTIYGSASSKNVSNGTQLYLVVMNVLGLGFIGDSGNFRFVHNVTAFDTSTEFGDVGLPLIGALDGTYFPSLLFCSLLMFALFHYVLSFRLPRRVFQSCHGLVAGICAIGMIASSLALGFLTGLMPEDWENAAQLMAFNQNINPAMTSLLPCLLFGACVAEMRFHFHRRLKAVLGHWLVVDLSILAFVVFTALPHFGGATITGGLTDAIAAKCAAGNNDHSLSAAQKVACSSIPARHPSSSMSMLKGMGVSAAQFVLFAWVLLSLSCQAYHKKRSLVVFSVFKTSLMTDVFGRLSYPLYLIMLQVIFGPLTKWWLCLGSASECSGPSLPDDNFFDHWMLKV